jgi:hypothetical protein
MDVYRNSPPPGFDPQTVQPVACEIPAAVGTDGKSSQKKDAFDQHLPNAVILPVPEILKRATTHVNVLLRWSLL